MSIHNEDRVVGGVGECPIAALALEQRGLSCLAIGNVPLNRQEPDERVEIGLAQLSTCTREPDFSPIHELPSHNLIGEKLPPERAVVSAVFKRVRVRGVLQPTTSNS